MSGHRAHSARAWRTVVRREWARPGSVFTQGLAVAAGGLWESKGQYGSSGLREMCPESGEPRWSGALPGRLFGEGLCRSPAGLWQLTWRENVAVEWDLVRRRIRREVAYDREGWGACNSPIGVVTSDGTDELVIRDPRTLRELRVLTVVSAGHPVFGLNDLEWSAGRIWANVYGLDCYLGIDPVTGSVVDLVDARDLRIRAGSPARLVLNGLARASSDRHFYATGKCWPRLFAVDFVAADFDPFRLFELPRSNTLTGT